MRLCRRCIVIASSDSAQPTVLAYRTISQLSLFMPLTAGCTIYGGHLVINHIALRPSHRLCNSRTQRSTSLQNSHSRCQRIGVDRNCMSIASRIDRRNRCRLTSFCKTKVYPVFIILESCSSTFFPKSLKCVNFVTEIAIALNCCLASVSKFLPCPRTPLVFMPNHDSVCESIAVAIILYTVGHKKRASLFWTTTPAFLDEFQHFVHQ